jgi:hypothetical protein
MLRPEIAGAGETRRTLVENRLKVGQAEASGMLGDETAQLRMVLPNEDDLQVRVGLVL